MTNLQIQRIQQYNKPINMNLRNQPISIKTLVVKDKAARFHVEVRLSGKYLVTNRFMNKRKYIEGSLFSYNIKDMRLDYERLVLYKMCTV